MKRPRNRPRSLSRHTVVVIAATTLAPGAGKGATGPALPASPIAAIAAQWRVVKQAEAALVARWSNIETRLVDHFRWADLTDDEQKALPEAAELHAINAQLQQLEADRRHCPVVLVGLPATSRDDLQLKLQVVADLLNPGDHALAHRLLTTAIGELKALT